MKVGFLNYYEHCNNNKMFLDSSAHGLGDDLTYPYVRLYEKAKSMGIEISTIDSEPFENYDMIFFIDFPTFKNRNFKELIESKYDKDMILMIYECEIVMPDNWNPENHRYFNKIYTWNDDLVDNKKYFKYFDPNKIPEKFDFKTGNRKLCTLIAGNKYNYHPLELYSERVNAIRWFEKNHPEDFDLYGTNWDKKADETLANLWGTAQFTINKNARPDEPVFTSYRGKVERKNDTLKNYKFSICYENAKDIPGYITEKIFDSFFAGCIPIYLGAPNITDYIPKETFIDKREFDSYADLYNHIKNMDHDTYNGYVDAIRSFVTGGEIQKFGSEFYADIILKEINNHSQNSIKKRLGNLFNSIKSNTK